jgi:hypothetical protein
MIYKRINGYPKSINVDFERDVFNAVSYLFGANVDIYGCYFHLSQNFFKHVRNTGFYIPYQTNAFFKKCFLYTQSSAFLPPADVVNGFLKVKLFCYKNCPEFMKFLDYVEKYYIGEHDEKTKIRKKPYSSILTWNLHHRILNNKPRTNNKVERFNQKIQKDNGDHHLSTINMIEALRLEQVHTESIIPKIDIGLERPNKLQIDLDKSYLNVLKQYKSSDMFSFMGLIGNIISIYNEKNSKKHKNVSASSSSDDD